MESMESILSGLLRDAWSILSGLLKGVWKVY